MITDEYRREMQVSVPKAIAKIEDVTLTSLVVFRKDLPNEYLTNSFFPLLTHPNTPAVMIVPSKFLAQRASTRLGTTFVIEE